MVFMPRPCHSVLVSLCLQLQVSWQQHWAPQSTQPAMLSSNSTVQEELLCLLSVCVS